MFKTLVVALDLEADGDRALPIVHLLSRCGPVQVELVTVSEPGVPTAVDAYELEQRAVLHGWDPDAWTVVRAVDVAGGLVQHAGRREDALLVMATSARQPLTSSLFGSVTHDVLRITDRPVLLIGPNVPVDIAVAPTDLLACLDDSDAEERAIPAIVSWQATFDAATPRIVEVVRADEAPAAADRRMSALADLLEAQHIHSTRALVCAADPVAGLLAAAAGLSGPVYVAVSARYTDGRLHWHSSTQRLVQQAAAPVLVVPARPAPMHVRRVEPALDEHAPFHGTVLDGVPEPNGAVSGPQQATT